VNANGESGRVARERSGLDGTMRAGAEEWVVVALGSNQGESVALLRSAMERLQEFSNQPLRRSSLWRTAPVDCPAGSPDFLNAVVAWAREPEESPESLLEKLQALEREFGRRPKAKLNEPRPLDLDLIAFGTERRESAQLTLPHPRAVDRAFVLNPLAEVLPNLVLPGQARTVRELVCAAETLEPRQIASSNALKS
jgi:2-amino-4-hydroxy-6-hydroxymethyldihydropteridine diphosphokinase